MACLIQRDGGNDRHLVFRSPLSVATQAFSAEAGVIDLDLSPQNAGILPLGHRPQDLFCSSQAVL
jgi:hypothetical protein